MRSSRPLNSSGILSVNDCHISGEPVRCGILRVPEDWTRPAGGQLALAIMVRCRTQEDLLTTGEPWKTAMLENGWA